MNYTIEVKYENGIVFAYTTGKDSYEITYEIWTKIMAVCKANNCFRVLGIQNMTPLKTIEAYDVEKVFRELGVSMKYKIAWIEEDAETREMLEYSAAVLRNRNLLNGGLFTSQSAALKWLRSDEPI